MGVISELDSIERQQILDLLSDFVPELVVGTLTADAATIDGATALRATSESGATPGFGNWATADPDRPAFVIVEAAAETDGTNNGLVTVDIDRDGDGVADVTMTVSKVHGDLSAGASLVDESISYLPPGAQYRVNNAADPNAGNAIDDVREVIL